MPVALLAVLSLEVILLLVSVLGSRMLVALMVMRALLVFALGRQS